MASLTTLRHLAIGIVLILIVAACGSAAAPTPTVSPILAASASPTEAATAVPTASPTAVPTATVAATCQQYTRDSVAGAFTDKFGITFGKEKSTGAPANALYVESPLSADKIKVVVANKPGEVNILSLGVYDYSNKPTISQEMVFALELISLSPEANTWVQSEYDKAYADKNTNLDDTNKTFACHVRFGSFLNSEIGAKYNEVDLIIYPASTAP